MAADVSTPARLIPSPARRRLLSAAVGGTFMAALGVPGQRCAVAQSRVAGRSPGVTRIGALADDLHLLDVAGTNVVAMTDASGIVLVDGGPAEYAAALAELTATLPGGGVHTLFNTCWHRSQTGSNELLGRAGATIIAHENARLWLTTDVTWPWDGSHFAPLPEVARPNKTYYSKAAIDTGGRRIEYGHVRASPHTDGDTYVFFRDANVLAVGQAAAGTGWPSIDWRTGGWLGGVVGAMELLLVLADDDTQIVPARGPVLTRADIAEQHEMYDTLYERFVNLLYDGLSPAEALAARPTAEFDAKFGPSDEFVTRAFQSLWGYLTPDV